ncbi:MAG TPA: hypothetical protein DEF41_06305 [Desulfovibrio sp.]|uniref:Uncharacterized protein n=2 Tax=Nitratidesulfovibrio vulgaris TaxID=881 RepID=Q72CI2_NITV2|nr:hypothetical protein DVU_1301 [Nitratidesulfovibrio vulgaris str. Hildenborough]ABM28784.1 conserved hypothetical protein [Nitratidesulfovibrio vulgaris DP4]HBW15737.1 hypothetical protein [Desulfovibrio sp.]
MRSIVLPESASKDCDERRPHALFVRAEIDAATVCEELAPEGTRFPWRAAGKQGYVFQITE